MCGTYEIIRLAITYMTSPLTIFSLLQYKTKIFYVAGNCTVLDERRGQNEIRTSTIHLAVPRVPLFCSRHILSSSPRDLSLNRRRATESVYQTVIYLNVGGNAAVFLILTLSLFHVSYLLHLCHFIVIFSLLKM